MARAPKINWWDKPPRKPLLDEDAQLRDDLRQILGGLPSDHPAQVAFMEGASAIDVSRQLGDDPERAKRITLAILDWQSRRWRPELHPAPREWHKS